MKFTYENKEYEFTGKYCIPKTGDYFLTNRGNVLRYDVRFGIFDIRAIVTPIKRKYTFGDVVFEETGEIRQPKKGEWYTIQTGDHIISCCWFATGNGTYSNCCIILCPIEIT